MVDQIAHLHTKMSERELTALKRQARKHKISLSEFMRALAQNILANEAHVRAANRGKKNEAE